MENRYYWLKFRSDFFDSKRIKKLRNMAGGDTYTIIYLKMQLKALKTDGVLTFAGIEEQFADELALDLDERPDDVRVTLMFLLQYGLCECSDNIHYFLPWVAENTGSETASTQRVRDYRNRQKALHCNADVTQVKRIGNAEKEIEIEKDKDNTYSVDFELFWKEYPRKIDKQKAYRSWKKIPVKEYLDIAKGLEKWNAYWTERNEPQYIPHPTVWLNNRRWESEPPKITKKRNAALNYQQSEIKKEDWERMVISLDEQ